jgi:hypothetical protein
MSPTLPAAFPIAKGALRLWLSPSRTMNHTLEGPDARWQFEITERARIVAAAAEALTREEEPNKLAPSRGILFGLAFCAAVIGGIVAIALYRVLPLHL